MVLGHEKNWIIYNQIHGIKFKPSLNCFHQHMMHQGWDSNYMFFIFNFLNVEWRLMPHIFQYK
jgi:hypothetical protein